MTWGASNLVADTILAASNLVVDMTLEDSNLAAVTEEVRSCKKATDKALMEVTHTFKLLNYLTAKAKADTVGKEATEVRMSKFKPSLFRTLVMTTDTDRIWAVKSMTWDPSTTVSAEASKISEDMVTFLLKDKILLTVMLFLSASILTSRVPSKFLCTST